MRTENNFPMRTGASEVEISLDYVGFHLGNQQYALSLEYVERALRMVAVTPVPESHPWIVGIINIQGCLLPVISLRKRLHLAEKEIHLDDGLLVISDLDRSGAFIVDDFTEVLTVLPTTVETVPASLSKNQLLTGVIRKDDEMILVLDVSRLLPSQDSAASWEQENIRESPIVEDPILKQDDDLTEIKGIGIIYSDRLTAGGVRTFNALARLTAGKLVDLLNLSKSRLPNVQGWIDQAAQRITE